MFNKSALQKVIKNKVSPENPCGLDIRQTTSFAELKGEVRKMEQFTGHVNVNWSKVSKQSLAILQTESKDILVAVYLVIALSKVYGTEGLVQGLDFLTELTNKFSRDLQPQTRPKSYSIALGWLVKQLQKNFNATFFSSLDKKHISQFKSSLQHLNQAAEKHFKDDSIASLVLGITRQMAGIERKLQLAAEASPIVAEPIEENTEVSTALDEPELIKPIAALDARQEKEEEKVNIIKESTADVEF